MFVESARPFLAAGLDGCRAGWVCAGWDGEAWSLTLLPDLSSVVPRLAPSATVCIDIPIGLSDDGFRACDRDARQLLGPRRSSVFSVPPRLALREASYAEINAASKRHCGRGVSKQAFYLLPKIREAERLLRSSPERYAGWLETHPELCFYALNGGIPMEDNKKTDAGYRQRLSLLEGQISQNMLEDMLSRLAGESLRSHCTRDDMVDALVCGVVATLDADRRACLPQHGEEYDAVGLPMRICYPMTVRPR